MDETTLSKRYMELVFFIKEDYDYYWKYRSLDFINYYLCYKGEGGFDDNLIEKGWATHVDCGTILRLPDSTRYGFKIDLTSRGFSKLKEITDTFFEYLLIFKDSIDE